MSSINGEEIRKEKIEKESELQRQRDGERKKWETVRKCVSVCVWEREIRKESGEREVERVRTMKGPFKALWDVSSGRSLTESDCK